MRGTWHIKPSDIEGLSAPCWGITIRKPGSNFDKVATNEDIEAYCLKQADWIAGDYPEYHKAILEDFKDILIPSLQDFCNRYEYSMVTVSRDLDTDLARRLSTKPFVNVRCVYAANAMCDIFRFNYLWDVYLLEGFPNVANSGMMIDNVEIYKHVTSDTGMKRTACWTIDKKERRANRSRSNERVISFLSSVMGMGCGFGQYRRSEDD